MNTHTRLSQAYMEGHASAAAALLERFTPDSVAAALSAADPAVAATVLCHLSPATATACLLELSSDTACDLLQLSPLHLSGVLLRRVPAAHRDRLLANMPGAFTAPLTRLLHYPERTAGALLDPLVTALPLDVTASEALDAVRTSPERVDHEIFVIGRDQVLVGSIPLRTLVAAPATARIETLATPVIARFSALSDAKALLASPAWADTHTVPVVDAHGLYLGALRYDAILRLAADRGAASAAQSSASTLVSLSELCWSGCAGLISELTAAAIQRPQSARGSHGV